MRLEDEVASEAIKEASRAYVEDALEKGIASTKKRTRVRDYSEAVRVRPHRACPPTVLQAVVPAPTVALSLREAEQEAHLRPGVL